MNQLRLVKAVSLEKPAPRPTTVLTDQQEQILAEFILFLLSEDNAIMTGVLDDRGEFERPVMPQAVIRNFLNARNTDNEDAIKRLASLEIRTSDEAHTQ